MSEQEVSEMHTPEFTVKTVGGVALVSTPSSEKIPTGTLAARRQDCLSSLKQQELERKFQEELRWYKKQADHYQQEYENARVKRKELEEQLDAVKAEMDKRVKEALADAEDLKLRGGEKGIRTELETMKRELDQLKTSKANTQAQLADAVEGSKVLHKQLHDAKEKLSALEASKQAVQDAAAASAAEAAQLALSLQRHLQELQGKLDALESEKQAAEDATYAAEADAKTLKGSLEEMQTKLAEAEESSSKQAAQISTLNTQLSDRSSACEQLQKEVSGLQSKGDLVKQQLTELQQQTASLKEQLRSAQACSNIGEDEVSALKAAAAAGETQAAAAKTALDIAACEFAELKTEYARAVYDCAKARAEHSEMAGKLAKVIAQKDQLQSRLATLQIAHTEVELCAKLALENDLLGAASLGDQDAPHQTNGTSNGGAANGHKDVHISNGTDTNGSDTSKVDSNGTAGAAGAGGGVSVVAGGVALLRAMVVARQHLQKVRKLAADAQHAADKGSSTNAAQAQVFKRSVSMAASTTHAVAHTLAQN